MSKNEKVLELLTGLKNQVVLRQEVLKLVERITELEQELDNAYEEPHGIPHSLE